MKTLWANRRASAISRANERYGQKGVSSIEYALLAALIAMIVVGSVGATGTSVKKLYEDVSNKVACAVSKTGC